MLTVSAVALCVDCCVVSELWSICPPCVSNVYMLLHVDVVHVANVLKFNAGFVNSS